MRFRLEILIIVFVRAVIDFLFPNNNNKTLISTLRDFTWISFTVYVVMVRRALATGVCQSAQNVVMNIDSSLFYSFLEKPTPQIGNVIRRIKSEHNLHCFFFVNI